MTSNPPSGASTPNDRFKSQSTTTEELLQAQTTGLVNLSDYRKRRLEVEELKDRAAQDAVMGRSRGATPASGTEKSAEPPKKKKKKVGKPILSFGMDEEETSGDSSITTPRSQTSSPRAGKITANASISMIPKAQTKKSLLQESQAREALRKEFIQIQERVKNSEIALPFVFYDGSNIPGGVVRVKKGDHVWMFLDGSRKVGAESGTGVNGREGEASKARREWARVGVDDLMMVRGEIIIPHHYDFYYFIMNKTLGTNMRRLFEYSADAPLVPEEVAEPLNLDTYDPMAKPSKSAKLVQPEKITDLEGADSDPTYTKVVDRRWYEKNKHIYPASLWQDFDPEKDYQNTVKRDAGGNAFFFS